MAPTHSSHGQSQPAAKDPNLPAKPLADIQPGQARPAPEHKPKASHPHALTKNHSTKSGVFLSDLHWWTSDVDIAAALSAIGAPIPAHHVAFSEHKVNGKSKGMAYVELDSYDSARKVKRWFDANFFQQKQISVNVGSAGTSNPFRTLPKEPYKENSSSNQQANSRAAHHKSQVNLTSDHKYKNYTSPQHNQPQAPSATTYYPYQQPVYPQTDHGTTNDFANNAANGAFFAGELLPQPQQYQSVYPYGQQQIGMQGGVSFGSENGGMGNFVDEGYGNKRFRGEF